MLTNCENYLCKIQAANKQERAIQSILEVSTRVIGELTKARMFRQPPSPASAQADGTYQPVADRASPIFESPDGYFEIPSGQIRNAAGVDFLTLAAIEIGPETIVENVAPLRGEVGRLNEIEVVLETVTGCCIPMSAPPVNTPL
jgi:hypothetical protein